MLQKTFHIPMHFELTVWKHLNLSARHWPNTTRGWLSGMTSHYPHDDCNSRYKKYSCLFENPFIEAVFHEISRWPLKETSMVENEV